MKRIQTIPKLLLITVILLSLAFSFAETTEQTGGSMSVTLDGQHYTLPFDSNAQYSYIDGDIVAASFYAYDENNVQREAFLIVPLSAQSGSVFSTDTGIGSEISEVGIMMISTDTALNMETGIATCVNGLPYPEGSSMTLRLSAVTVTDSLCSMAGSLDCTLAMVDDQYQVTGTQSFSAEFSFTLTRAAGVPETAPPATIAPDSSIQPFVTPAPYATPEPKDSAAPPKQTPNFPNPGFGGLSPTSVPVDRMHKI